MQDLLNNFGVNGFLLAAQLVNFLIVLYLIKRFALKPILKLLQDRKKTIAESLENAKETQELLERTQEKEKDILRKAQSQAQDIIADARKESSLLQQEAENAAKDRVERMIADAQKKIEEQTHIAKQELAKHVTKLSIEILEKSLHGFFSEKDQKLVIEKALKKIKN